MSTTDRKAPAAMHTARRAARAVADAVRECNYASRRMLELRLFPQPDAGGRDRAPDTYAEFLYRSPLTLWQEPSAVRRATGARPRR